MLNENTKLANTEYADGNLVNIEFKKGKYGPTCLDLGFSYFFCAHLPSESMAKAFKNAREEASLGNA